MSLLALPRLAVAALLLLSASGFDPGRADAAELERPVSVRVACDGNADCPGDEICFAPTRTCQPPCQVQCLVPDPVCGSDGVTYACGKTDARCHGAGVVHAGECAPQRCHRNEECDDGEICFWPTRTCQPPCQIECVRKFPVCGEDGVTYPCGRVDAFCRGVRPVHRGECEPCACPDVWAPVCGADGETYGNACEARCAGAEVVHEGECREGCRDNADCGHGEICFPPTRTCQPPCEIQCLVPDPVCGSDGRTYACGKADAACHGAEVEHDGPCAECLCPDVWAPVCGVDGHTYANACEARCAHVEVLHDGECRECRPDPWPLPY